MVAQASWRSTDTLEEAGENSLARVADKGQPLGGLAATATLTHERMAEQVLIGCVLVDDFEVWGELEQYPIEAEDFVFPEHKAIWRAFRRMYCEGISVDVMATVLMLDEMDMTGAVERWLEQAGCGGALEYLAGIHGFSFSARGCGAYLRAVQHYARMRAPVNFRRGREIEID